MTTNTKRQIYSATGTIGGWLLGKLFDAKDALPYTVLGGIVGLTVFEQTDQAKAEKKQLKKA